ncbi:MAG: GntR family transcriptional regulator [Sphingomonas oligoaromativorans]
MMTETDRMPLYAQVEATLAARILAGKLEAGDRLPTEDELVQDFAVSRTTVRSAVQNLVKRGMVEIRRGLGTFVAQPRIVQELTSLTGFVEDMETLGHSASARLIDWQEVHADEVLARQLELALGTSVIRIRRVRLSNGRPLSYDDTYLPPDLGRRVVTDNLEVEPIFMLLEEKYDTPLAEARYELGASVADHEVAQALGIGVGAAVFLIERTSYTVGGRPVDYERLHYRGDQVRFVTRLQRRTKPSSSGGQA